MNIQGGRNIAMKVPPSQWEQTVAFYRDVLGLRVIKSQSSGIESVAFQFGSNQLWVDKVPALSQAEVWLELTTDDVQKTEKHLNAHNTVRCDEIEPLPAGFEGFWIQNPAAIVHIVKRPDAEE